MKKTVVIVLVLVLAYSCNIQAEIFDTFSINTDIDTVITNGQWQDGSRSGCYRLVVINSGWEHIKSFLYLQWIYFDQAKQISVIINSVPIDEFNQKDWRHFISASFNENNYIIDYENRGRGTTQRAVLTPILPGKYFIDIKNEPL